MSEEKKMELEKLKDPFSLFDVEWRIQSAGFKRDKAIWAKCLVYITNRAIMDRLDEVCGPENWRNEYAPAPEGGTLCGISIRINGEWITKWDGAEKTAIDAVKGGLSGSMKRAGVQWGIGRYLYNIKENWAKVSEGGELDGSFKDKVDKKKIHYFKWTPPQLPKWALPKGEQGSKENGNSVSQTTTEDMMTAIMTAIKGAETLNALKTVWKNNWEAIQLLSEEQQNELSVAKDMRKANIEGGE
jgi:hypothetical protein